MSPHPDEDDRVYDLATRPSRLEHALQGKRHPAPGDVRTALIDVATTGAPRQASGAATSEQLSGAIIGLHFAYAGEAPPTTDVRVSRIREGQRPTELLLVPESATDAYHAPNSAPIWRPVPTSFSYVPFVLEDHAVEVRVTDCDPLPRAVRVTVFYHDMPGLG